MAFLTYNSRGKFGHARRGPVLRLAVALVLSVICGARWVAAAPAPAVTREQEVKAAAFYNIIIFTEWPATAFTSPDAPLVIGVLGQGPVATLLSDLVANETWHGRRVVLEHYVTPAQIKSCHVLYVARSEHARWPSIRNQFAGLPLLTVGDADNFARDGGVVQFGIERNKLKLIVNLSAARNSGLTISSKVLRLADIIGEGP